MARISKPGLDYFPLDVNFLQDRKVRRISCRHHAAGIAALTSLLCLIYKEKGYYINNIQPVDMFPQTSNVECVVCLEKR